MEIFVDDERHLQSKSSSPNEYYPHSWVVSTYIAGGIATAASAYAVFFLTCILSNREARSKAYNVYLLALVLPDCQLNVIWAMAAFYEASHEGTYPSQSFCLARNGSSYLYYYGNLYLNAIVAREVFQLVFNSYRRIRTPPPSISLVLRQVSAVYAFAGVVTMWSVATVPWSLFTVSDPLFCHTSLGSEYIPAGWSTVIGFGVVLPPIAYVVYLYYRIRRERLLPVSGRTHAVYMYFFRILVVFFAFYLPNTTIAFLYMTVQNNHSVRYWVMWIFRVMVPFQCLVTIRLACSKEDISLVMRTGIRRLTYPSAMFSSLSGMIEDPSRRSSLRFGSGPQNVATTSKDKSKGTSPSSEIEVLAPPNISNHLTSPQSEWDQDDVYLYRQGSTASMEIADTNVSPLAREQHGVEAVHTSSPDQNNQDIERSVTASDTPPKDLNGTETEADG